MGLIVQLTGLSGSGKTTLVNKIDCFFSKQGLRVKIFDGDICRRSICADLGFSKSDRIENVKRIGQLAYSFKSEYDLILLSIMNPFEESRNYLRKECQAPLIHIKCSTSVLIERDTKDLYKRALLPSEDPNKIYNLTGINDLFEFPQNSDLCIDTEKLSIEESLELFKAYLTSRLLLKSQIDYFGNRDIWYINHLYQLNYKTDYITLNLPSPTSQM